MTVLIWMHRRRCTHRAYRRLGNRHLFGKVAWTQPVPRIGRPIREMDPTLVVIGHLMLLRDPLNILPKAWWIKHVDKPYNTIPFRWNRECLGIDISGLQR